MCLYKNNFCLAERFIHDSYLCLANISSFLCFYFRVCKKKLRGLKASHIHNQNVHISRSAVYQDGVGTMVTASALWFAVWWQSYLQLREGFGHTGDSSCCSLWLAQGHQIQLYPLQPDPSALHLFCFSAWQPWLCQDLDHHPQGSNFQL